MSSGAKDVPSAPADATLKNQFPVLIGGRFERLHLIGCGAFGHVHRCRDTVISHQSTNPQDVAVKVIPASVIEAEGHRLAREVDILLFLRNKHPHILSCFHVFTSHALSEDVAHVDGEKDELASLRSVRLWFNGAREMQAAMNKPHLLADQADISHQHSFELYVTMPLLGGDMRHLIRDTTGKRPVDVEPPEENKSLTEGNNHSFLSSVSLTHVTAVVLGFQLLFALDYLHQCGIVHRDLKPENVLVRICPSNPFNSTVVLADFGLACAANQDGSFYACTRMYRPPELVVGQLSSHPAIDLWSVGCILFELVTGNLLFEMTTARNIAGEWDGVLASHQLEHMMNVVGTPDHNLVKKQVWGASNPVRSYLLQTQERPPFWRERLMNEWRLHDADASHREAWASLIGSCLAFFPGQRPSAQVLCQHELFTSFGIHYGHNVQQVAPECYCPAERTPFLCQPDILASRRPAPHAGEIVLLPPLQYKKQILKSVVTALQQDLTHVMGNVLEHANSLILVDPPGVCTSSLEAVAQETPQGDAGEEKEPVTDASDSSLSSMESSAGCEGDHLLSPSRSKLFSEDDRPVTEEDLFWMNSSGKEMFGDQRRAVSVQNSWSEAASRPPAIPPWCAW